jgi:hypothetical protein
MWYDFGPAQTGPGRDFRAIPRVQFGPSTAQGLGQNPARRGVKGPGRGAAATTRPAKDDATEP